MIFCTPAANGRAVMALTTGRPTAQRRSIISAPAGSSASSSHMEISISSLLPTSSGGTNGNAGMSCLSAVPGLIDRHPNAHHRAEVVCAEGEPRDHPEVAAAAPECPQQLGVLVGGDLDHLAAGQHQLKGDELVAG